MPAHARWLSLVILLIAGCSEQHFRSETAWHSDGRVDRAIYQPEEFFPEDARTKWAVVQAASEIPSEAFTGSIRDLPVDRGDKSRHIAAWGDFPSAEAIPASLHVVAADPAKSSTLKRDCVIDDLGLVNEYRWKETLTDVVSLVDMAIARREAIAVVADVVETALGDQEKTYDTKKLVHWIRDDAARCFEELHAELVEEALRGSLGREQANSSLPGRLADIASRYGLNLRSLKGELLTNDELTAAIGRFLVEKVRTTVTDADGKPLDEPHARVLLAKLGLTEPERLTWNSNPGIENAITARFGTQDNARKHSAALTTRLFGVYMLGSFQPRRPMRFELDLPGRVAESTGQLVSDHTVVWQFDASEAFPFGYAMSARSLAANDAVQKKLLGSVRISSLEQMSEYARLLKADPSLLVVMKSCTGTGSLKPLDDYEAVLRSSGDDDPVIAARHTALRRLLAPPTETP